MDYLQQLLAAQITDDETAMSAQEVEDALYHLDEWELTEDAEHGYQIQREYELKTSQDAVAFVNRVNEVAAELHHFPDMHILGTLVEVTCYTEGLTGLHRNDFIMAAHADDLYARWDVITGKRDKVTEASDESFPASDPRGY